MIRRGSVEWDMAFENIGIGTDICYHRSFGRSLVIEKITRETPKFWYAGQKQIRKDNGSLHGEYGYVDFPDEDTYQKHTNAKRRRQVNAMMEMVQKNPHRVTDDEIVRLHGQLMIVTKAMKARDEADRK